MIWFMRCGVTPAQRAISAGRTPAASADRYRGHLADLPQTANALNAHIVGVRSFFRWMAEERHLAASPALFLKPFPRPRVSTRTPLAFEDLVQLLRHADTHADPYERAVIYMLACTGIRPHEILAADVTAIGVYNGQATLWVRRRKQGTAARFHLPEPAASAVRAAIGERTSGPLILDQRTRTRLTAGRARDRLAKLLRDADLPHITPACLRTTWITLGRQLGVSLEARMIGAGHSSLAQTLYYDRSLDQLIGEAAEAVGSALTAALQTP